MKISTENKIINFSKFLIIIGICGAIYLAVEIQTGLQVIELYK